MSTTDDEHLKRLGTMHEGDHLNALERLEIICTHATPGQAAGMSKMVANSATRAAGALQGLVAGLEPRSPPPPSPKGKGTLPTLG